MRNRKADLAGCFQIDAGLERLRLLHGKIGGLRAFQNLVHIRSGASQQVGSVSAIVHQAAGFRIFRLWVIPRSRLLIVARSDADCEIFLSRLMGRPDNAHHIRGPPTCFCEESLPSK